MYPNYNYYQQQPNTASYLKQSYGLKGRPVSSIEEARASTIDFDGSVFFFPDLANKCIYTKQINIDGTATLNMYELKEIPIQTPMTANNYITREEFEMVINQLKTNLTNNNEIKQQVPIQQIPKQEEILNF